MMLEKKFTDFTEELSSAKPVPGGGGACAAVGAFAAALGMRMWTKKLWRFWRGLRRREMN